MDDLEEAITHFHHSLTLRPPGHSDRPNSLCNLATAILTRFQQLGQMEDLEEAINFHQQALALYPLNHPNRSSSLNNLANAISTRFEQLGQMEDLEVAIKYHRQALVLRPPGHPDRSSSLNNLATAVSTRFKQLGQMEDLEEAIKCHRQALVLHPPGHPNHSLSLNNLGEAVSTRFEQLGQMEDLEEAIMYHRQALVLHPPGHPNCGMSLSNLANAVSTRFQQLGQMEDLEEAIKYHRQALVLRPPGHPDRSRSLNNLANAVSTRFKQLGQMEDLEEAIEYHRQALVLRPPGHPDRSMSLNNLANAVSTRFYQLGHIEDLQEAIKYHRQALVSRPPGHPDRSMSLSNLANAVSTRFKQLGHMEDLEEAIMYHRQGLVLRPSGHPDRGISLDSLANAVSTRFKQLGQMEDLEEAIEYHRQALVLHPPGHSDHSASLNNLALDISARFEQLGQMEDLEEAIKYHRQALLFSPPGHPYRSLSLNNLAIDISTRFHRLGHIEDLQEAIKLQSGAEQALPSDHPDHAEIRSRLASNILEMYRHSTPSEHTLQMASDAFALFESATHHSASPAHGRFLSALSWAQEARRCGHSSLLYAYSTALTCLDRCVTLTPTIHSWQKFLARVPQSLASDAASSAIEAGDLALAVELLEQGRGILWSKIRAYRHPRVQLRNMDPNLADEFDRVSRDLERHAIASQIESPLPPGFFDRQTERHRILSSNWDEVLQRIRQIDGFTHFLQAIPFASLQLAATEGPVIVVNISEYRSDAIILRQSDSPVLVCLPRATPEALLRLSKDLSSALALDNNSWKPIFPILRTLWDLVVAPVVDQLAILGVTKMSRIWWCPTSQLCGLPLHATGPYKSGQKSLPDIYISSYTPTLSSLIRARANVVHRPPVPKLLVMGQPDDNNKSSRLPHVREEVCRIHSLGESIDVLLGEQASCNTLLPRLQQYPWVHFACHGYLVAKEPFLSYFQLHNNERLTLGDLIMARLSDAELAFSSACHSAAIDMDSTPDETINLATALQLCGFRSVVGTLWAMTDINGPDVAEDFYQYMFHEAGAAGNFRGSAAALNHATRMMRKRKVTIDRWINFVHIGA